MRPRVFPAEDRRTPRVSVAHVGTASMRPRVFPAEDGRKVGEGIARADALQ